MIPPAANLRPSTRQPQRNGWRFSLRPRPSWHHLSTRRNKAKRSAKQCWPVDFVREVVLSPAPRLGCGGARKQPEDLVEGSAPSASSNRGKAPAGYTNSEAQSTEANPSPLSNRLIHLRLAWLLVVVPVCIGQEHFFADLLPDPRPQMWRRSSKRACSCLQARVRPSVLELKDFQGALL